ncbi:MAG: hypothetical protein HY914_01785 [Desulfomonile tiedjei]|nr:hypothetical protein [Desulfomonile tiedjei]
MARADEIEDLDELIDRAVDTFFVEAPSEEELNLAVEETSPPPPPTPAQPQRPSKSPRPGPSLDEAVESLFTSSFHEALDEDSTDTMVTSGNDDIDRAIDLAVDTLFVEEPETPIPETTQLRVESAEPASVEPLPPSARPRAEGPPTRTRPVAKAPRREPEGPEATVSYDDVMAKEIERHMRTVYEEQAPVPPPVQPRKPPEAAAAPATPVPAARRPAAPPAPPPPPSAKPMPTPKVQRPAPTAAKPALGPRGTVSPVRKLQEAILTLEWEISKRSVTTLAGELRKLRVRFQDDMTVDFAAVAMKLVLEYITQRLSRSHPESVRFLLGVTEFLDTSLAHPQQDPLNGFHHIMTRYEHFKSVVRKAEGLPDRKPEVLAELEISDPQGFAKLVEAQALTLIKAGRALAKQMDQADDPKDLIRSFRFLVNRSVNRILESTRKSKNEGQRSPTRKDTRTRPSAH